MTDKSNVVPIAAAKPWFSVRASADQAGGIVEIYDEIDAFWGFGAREFISAVRDIDAEGAVIEIRLNSPGGDVFEAAAIATAISRLKARTVSVVDGLAASAASLIAVSTDELHMPANATLMIHAPWTTTSGSASDHRARAEVLDKVQGQFVAAYEAKATRTLGADRDGAESMADMVEAETWLTADEAVALGLADKILDAVKIAACVRPEILAHFNDKEKAAPFVLDASADGASDGSDPEGADGAADGGDAPVEVEVEVEVPEVEDAPNSDAGEEDAERNAEILNLCTLARAPEKAQAFMDVGASVAEVRTALLSAIAAGDDETDTRIPAAAPRDAATSGRKSLNQARLSGLDAVRGMRKSRN